MEKCESLTMFHVLMANISEVTSSTQHETSVPIFSHITHENKDDEFIHSDSIIFYMEEQVKIIRIL